MNYFNDYEKETKPNFDLATVEVGEILDGERRAEAVDAQTEELMLKIADYNNVEQKILSKRMCAMFVLALAGMVIYAVIGLSGQSGGLSQAETFFV